MVCIFASETCYQPCASVRLCYCSVFNGILQQNTSTLINFRLNDYILPEKCQMQWTKNVTEKTKFPLGSNRLRSKALHNMITLFIYLFFISMQHISPWIQLIRMNFDLSSHKSSSSSNHSQEWIVVLEHVIVHLLEITTYTTQCTSCFYNITLQFPQQFYLMVHLVSWGTLLKIGSMNKAICFATHQFDANDGSL